MTNEPGRLLLVAAALVAVSTTAVLAVREGDPSTIAGPDAVPAASAAPLPSLGAVPALDTSLGWLNAGAAGPALEGKVIAYQLWTFGCANCKNTLPFLRALAARYERDGLVVVGIHTPEFDHEADHGDVAVAVDELDVTWPVLFDDDKVNWRRFENRFWPRLFLADRSGAIRLDHVGEGGYAEIEDAVRSLLAVDPSSPRSTDAGRA